MNSTNRQTLGVWVVEWVTCPLGNPPLPSNTDSCYTGKEQELAAHRIAHFKSQLCYFLAE